MGPGDEGYMASWLTCLLADDNAYRPQYDETKSVGC